MFNNTFTKSILLPPLFHDSFQLDKNMSKKTLFWLSKNEKLAKKVDFRKFLDPIWDLVLKRISKFVIPKFRETLLVPKITKCGDLLYIYLHQLNHIIATTFFMSRVLDNHQATKLKVCTLVVFSTGGKKQNK